MLESLLPEMVDLTSDLEHARFALKQLGEVVISGNRLLRACTEVTRGPSSFQAAQHGGEQLDPAHSLPAPSRRGKEPRLQDRCSRTEIPRGQAAERDSSRRSTAARVLAHTMRAGEAPNARPSEQTVGALNQHVAVRRTRNIVIAFAAHGQHPGARFVPRREWDRHHRRELSGIVIPVRPRPRRTRTRHSHQRALLWLGCSARTGERGRESSAGSPEARGRPRRLASRDRRARAPRAPRLASAGLRSPGS